MISKVLGMNEGTQGECLKLEEDQGQNPEVQQLKIKWRVSSSPD